MLACHSGDVARPTLSIAPTGEKEDCKMPNDTYNGWTNYETWAVALWLGDDQGSYEEARAICRRFDNKYQAADILKAWIQEIWIDPTVERADGSMAADLLTAAFSRVNFQEIAGRLEE